MTFEIESDTDETRKVVESAKRALCEIAYKLQQATSGAACLEIFAQVLSTACVAEFGSKDAAARYLHLLGDAVAEEKAVRH